MQLRIRTACLAAIGAILQGCAPQTAAPTSHATLYATDLAGKAPSCAVPQVAVKDGAETPVAMTTGGGGWCGLAVDHGGQPFAAGLLTKPPRSGRVYVHTVGDDTRIDYTPDRSPVTADSFSVRLIPGDATLQIAVAAPAVSK